MKTLIADIETDGLLEDLTKIHCIGIKELGSHETLLFADEDGYRPISEALEQLDTADQIVMHNGIGFDYPAILRVYGRSATFAREKIYDTLVASRFFTPEKRSHSLEALGFELGFEKGTHDDWSSFTESMGAYCQTDCEVTAKVFEALYDPNFSGPLSLEFDFAWVISLQEQHGFKIDIEKAQSLESEFRQEMHDISSDLQRIWLPIITERYSEKTGKRLKDHVEIFNCSSRKQIGERLAAHYGWKPKTFTPTGQPKIDETVLEKLTYPEAQKLGRYFRLQKMMSQICDGDNSWLKKERNGYVHGYVRTVGTATHRASHFSPNLAQVDKKEPRMRECWLPDDGDVLVGCDADALELVALSHYLGKYDNGEYQKALLTGSKENGTDVHSRTQKLLELPTRDTAKSMQYAYLYGAGDKKLSQIAREAGAPIRDGKVIRRRMNEGINGLGELSSAIQKRADIGWFKAIDGRHIKCDSQHRMLNYLLQSCGAIVMKKALQVFHFDLATKAGHVRDESTVNFSYVCNVHDEVQLSVRPEYAEEIGQLFCVSITEGAKRLGLRCPLSGTYQIGNNWKETH